MNFGPDVGVYDGDWVSGKRTMHGRGKYTFPDGRVYDGDFRDGLKHGRGTMTFPDGAEYEGDFRGGKIQGRGTMTLPGGAEYDGDWVPRDDLSVTVTFPDGRVSHVEWRHGGLMIV